MQSRYAFLVAAVGLFAVACSPKDGAAPESSAAKTDNMSVKAATSPIKYAQVQKVFDQNCVGCHGATSPKADVNLTSFDALMRGGVPGPVVKPSDALGSLLIEVLHGMNGKKQMPPGKALPDDHIRLIEDWVIAGAKNDT